MIDFLNKLKEFFDQQWVQVVQVVVAIAGLITAITGQVIDLGQVTTVVTQIGVACLGLIWLIETIAAAFGKKKV
jgi:hypothetical protein